MAQVNNLMEEELKRYHRQIILPGWGECSQERLRNSRVFVAGLGGLGSPVTEYLAAVGVGHLYICDDGEPELSNLNRQILHSDADIGKLKTDSARETLKRINPHVEVECLQSRITKTTVSELVSDAELIVDCLDNFQTRYILNEFAVEQGLAMIHAGVMGLAGQITFLKPPRTPCLVCIIPEAPPTAVFPIVGATAGVIGCLEALEAIKYLTGLGRLLENRLLIWDGETMDFMEINIQNDPKCRVCGQ